MHDIATIRFRNLPAVDRFASQELDQLDGGAQTRRAGEIIGAALAVLVRDGNMQPSDARDILAKVHPFANEDLPPEFMDGQPPNIRDGAGDDAGAV